ncbi:MAG: hypothetical protein ABIH24_10290 [Verrucomicrobiota bacterium]
MAGELNPFPLETKLTDIFLRAQAPHGWEPTGLTKNIYAELSEPIVRQAAAWQDKDGRIIDPYEPGLADGFPSFTAARFVGALGFLISAGRCLDLVDVCARSLDITCRDLFHAHEKPIRGAEFYPKELMRGYLALCDKTDQSTVKRWKHLLGGYDPEKNYSDVLSKRKPDELHNFVTFAVAGETCKKKYGIADNTDFIERHIETQKQWFTTFGMYRDPNDPMTYDYTSRMNLALSLFWGYDGAHRAFVDEMLRRGGLTMLLYLSPTGEAPFGGRSNQFHFTEGTIALTCEYEAKRYKALGNMRLAGAFKRAARLTALSTKRWLDLTPIRHLKNAFPPQIQHGRQSTYGFYGVYSLLIASQFGFAHLMADDSIEEQPAPFETDGYIIHLAEAFHKVFATCQGYHLEIDTKADHHYDATGLGRIHLVSAPTELGFSAPIVAHPLYLVSTATAPRSVAIGPGWQDSDGNIRWLADFSDEIRQVRVDIQKETPQRIEFQVEYKGALIGCESVTEHYHLDSNGLIITDTVSGSIASLLVQVPLLETDGMHTAKINTTPNGFAVKYRKYQYIVECLGPSVCEARLEPFSAPNRNGIYKIGVFKVKGNKIVYRLNITNLTT